MKKYLKRYGWVVLLQGLFPVFLRRRVQSHIAKIILLKVVARRAQTRGVRPQVVPLKSLLSNLRVGLSEGVLGIVAWHEALVAWNGLVFRGKGFLKTHG